MSAVDDRLRLARSLEQLDDELASGELTPADYLRLRDDLIRERDEIQIVEASRSEVVVADSQSKSARKLSRPWFVLAGIFALAALAGWGVSLASGERLASDQVSGNIEQTSGDKLARAAELGSQDKVLDAIKLYDEVLATDPSNVEALAYKGWFLALSSPQLTDDALVYLTRAVQVDPSYPDAHVFRGITLFRGRGDAAGAVPELEAALASSSLPTEMRSLVQSTLDEARAAVSSPATTVP